MSSQKRFEDWEEVECNECERYWLNQCDGVKPSNKAQKVPCNSFLATRSVVIPEQIKKLNYEVFWLKLFVIILLAAVSLLFLGLVGR